MALPSLKVFQTFQHLFWKRRSSMMLSCCLPMHRVLIVQHSQRLFTKKVIFTILKKQFRTPLRPFKQAYTGYVMEL